MELVRGIKITDYYEQNHLPPRERLDLFIQVCRAIQHAHHKGIIHRDIKPSNILVASNDGVPVPKVIDFGIAKATQGRLTDQTVYTAIEQFIGTPAYMSPEQAQLSMQDIDTRTDIYSLGVLLYELLTGKTPFDAKELLAKGLDEMRRTIREVEPVKPSTRLTQEFAAADAGPQASSGKNEPKDRVSSRRLLQEVRGDLDWIVMKCLEKERGRRYETANGLAADIQRHLNCEVVLARPPSRLYEFEKTFRRHKFGFAAATAVILALMSGLGISLWSLARARSEAAKSEQEAQLLQHLLGSTVSAIDVNVSDDPERFAEVLYKLAGSINALTNEAAFKNNSDVQYMLGVMYDSGIGMPTNSAEALKWFLRSAEEHNIWADWRLARMYHYGLDVPKDKAEYVKWARKAAVDGHHGAQTALVRIYRSGDGVPKDEEEALKWEKIADKNDTVVLNLLAWDMATFPDPSVRNGSNAVAYAKRAVAGTQRNNVDFLDTLAAAYAETGQFSNAVEVQREAIRRLQSQRDKLAGYDARLKLYESGIPYRMQPVFISTNEPPAPNSNINRSRP
jgi:TPR repeat protein